MIPGGVGGGEATGAVALTATVTRGGYPATATIDTNSFLFYPVQQYSPKPGDVVLLLKSQGTVWGLGSIPAPTRTTTDPPVGDDQPAVRAATGAPVVVPRIDGHQPGTVHYGGAHTTTPMEMWVPEGTVALVSPHAEPYPTLSQPAPTGDAVELTGRGWTPLPFTGFRGLNIRGADLGDPLAAAIRQQTKEEGSAADTDLQDPLR